MEPVSFTVPSVDGTGLQFIHNLLFLFKNTKKFSPTPTTLLTPGSYLGMTCDGIQGAGDQTWVVCMQGKRPTHGTFSLAPILFLLTELMLFTAWFTKSRFLPQVSLGIWLCLNFTVLQDCGLVGLPIFWWLIFTIKMSRINFSEIYMYIWRSPSKCESFMFQIQKHIPPPLWLATPFLYYQPIGQKF